MKKAMIAMLSGALMTTGAAFAQQTPSENIDAKFHPELARAQMHLRDAYTEIGASRQKFDNAMGGHAAKAQELIDQADAELRAAATAANDHDKAKH
ncbi:MAG: hypothetical protein JOY51_02930 [Nevskia sp.]|nr:hypothetical protein [Nevskia sp.]